MQESNTSLIRPSQALEDLRWIFESPPLIKGTLVTKDFFPEVDVGALHRFLDLVQPNRQVGRYFERLVEFWLQEVRGVEMVASGLQIQEDGRTVGELDFVFRVEGGILTHWETAVKFFLHYRGEFIGPNAADTLERKVGHMMGHQIRLGRKAFPDLGKSGCLFKGCLYYHPGDPGLEDVPADVNPGHLRGTWIRVDELDSLPVGVGYHVLEKPHWFTTPVSGDAIACSGIRDQLTRHFGASGRPVHLMDSEGMRWFVVGEEWPGVGMN